MVSLPVKDSDERIELQPSKIIVVGLNYREHVEERGAFSRTVVPPPSEPVLSAKAPSCLIGPDEAIVVPAFAQTIEGAPCRIDYEAELAVIIGQRAKNISESNALDFVLGYTAFNDVSHRNYQKGDTSGWFRGKSLDTFGPIGPCVVPRERIPDPQTLSIQCRLDGKTVQSAHTGQMIFSVREIISYCSRHFTLEPGDIIITGTPSGVGPLHDGAVVEVEIAEIGTLKNHVEFLR
jgi:2-keto-4-pentenoate hydratase/2-oxohepta-3-ene-1,7-dioic acid hydratase in catechol pathway